MVLIGLVGQNRVGKDTLAEVLTKKYGFKQYALADPIKKIAQILFDFNEEQLNGCLKEEIDPKWNISPRQFYQQFGTEIMQYDIYKYLPSLEEKVPSRHLWVKIMEQWVKEQQTIGFNNIVISDIRFVHEAASIRDMNGILIKITRNSNNNNDNDNDNDNKNETNIHLSQKTINDIPDDWIDYSIQNNTSYDEYKNKINQYIQEFII